MKNEIVIYGETGRERIESNEQVYKDHNSFVDMQPAV